MTTTPDVKRRAQVMYESNATSRKWDDLEEFSKSVWIDRAIAVRESDIAEGLALVPVEPTTKTAMFTHYQTMIRAGNRYGGGG